MFYTCWKIYINHEWIDRLMSEYFTHNYCDNELSNHVFVYGLIFCHGCYIWVYQVHKKESDHVWVFSQPLWCTVRSEGQMRKMGCWWSLRWAKFASRRHTNVKPFYGYPLPVHFTHWRLFRYSPWVGCTESWKQWILQFFYNIPRQMGCRRSQNWRPTW